MKFAKGKPEHHFHFDTENMGFLERLFISPLREREGFYQGMFNQDFSQIFKSFRRRNEALFSIKSNDGVLIDKLLGNVKGRRRHHCLDDTVREWVEEIAQNLVRLKTVYYFLYEDAENEELHIVPLSSVNLFQFLNICIQLLPKRRKDHWTSDGELLPAELRILDTSKLIRIDISSAIKQLLLAQNRILTALDKHQHDNTAFYPKATYKNPIPRNNFDLNYWVETQDKALYRATIDTGWTGRKQDSSKRSDFFDCYRQLRFKRNQLILRDNILFQLGKELTRVGQQYNPEFEVVISPTNALPNVAELDKLKEQLSQEKVSFTDIIDFCYERERTSK
ncbi:hypothetical protein P3576_02200 [Vibrio parahaemolyticus]|jgi:hypothetical protein|uniref:hypothetical protein n=1 Tax=Vibrio harveyi group TaxID=717610 RepID=UPI0004297859|nr:hypothetical protein [Vibrio parahaemolyticus]HCZ9266951.1 hypothetical protein [Vibrio alginolyticus]EGR3302663.1 hypothetical protein [Vibrio parahaemolyticus]EGR3319726.1 hypothetical protein [Vibrio parahaemolyticus]EHH1059429.1 hypothetical protein [Vibrio parahaemolyticus]ELB2028918.1 hypothetical protein [Vibrio parahaemolyticus]